MMLCFKQLQLLLSSCALSDRLPTKYSESDNYNTFQESLLGMSNNDEIENN